MPAFKHELHRKIKLFQSLQSFRVLQSMFFLSMLPKKLTRYFLHDQEGMVMRSSHAAGVTVRTALGYVREGVGENVGYRDVFISSNHILLF